MKTLTAKQIILIVATVVCACLLVTTFVFLAIDLVDTVCAKFSVDIYLSGMLPFTLLLFFGLHLWLANSAFRFVKQGLGNRQNLNAAAYIREAPSKLTAKQVFLIAAIAGCSLLLILSLYTGFSRIIHLGGNIRTGTILSVHLRSHYEWRLLCSSVGLFATMLYYGLFLWRAICEFMSGKRKQLQPDTSTLSIDNP